MCQEWFAWLLDQTLFIIYEGSLSYVIYNYLTRSEF